jgi:hypothetical protein
METLTLIVSVVALAVSFVALGAAVRGARRS